MTRALRVGSACEVPFVVAARPGVARFDPRTFRWQGVPAAAYKEQTAGPLAWRGVERFVLMGGPQAKAAFELRYFEIAPGGYSSWERHAHAHAIVVVRGRGRVRLGRRVVRVRPLDFLFIPAGTPHQFRADGEPFGFLCPVDAVRDAPRPAARLRALRRRATMRRRAGSPRAGRRA
ncbi:MAG: cupin domain-containing protein [Armatimonadota bacterium]|nr:cupin domain-containing protein [Armatimonadota bacterium]MDR7536272.1 cupin domain-containing protein [Armatimonadota bacterium]